MVATHNTTAADGGIDITSDHVKELGFKVIFGQGHIIVEYMQDGRRWISKVYSKDFPKTIDKIEETLREKAADCINQEAIFNISRCVIDNFNPIMESVSGGGNGGNGKGNNSSNNKEEEELVKVPTLKYTTGIETANPRLWETVRIGSTFCFVSYDQATGRIAAQSEIQGEGDNSSKILVPSNEPEPEPISFKDRYQLEDIIQLAKGHTVGSLFKVLKEKYVSKFYDTDTEAYIDLIAADIIFSYFADRIGKTHYLFLWGEPGTGKGAIIETFHQLGYRVLLISDETSPTIFRSLGNVEKGQIVIIIDEANNLEKNSSLVTVFKVGYKGNTKVPRVMDPQSSALSRVKYYNAYSFKLLAAEKLPKKWVVGGLMDRCLFIHTLPGKPKIDISDIVDNAGDLKNAEIFAQLAHMKRILFAYRLIHYHEPIPDIEIQNEIVGRDRELVKPLLKLFMTHGHNAEALDTMKKSLHYFIKERNKEKTDESNAEVLKQVREYIQGHGMSKPPYEISTSDLWEHIEKELHGHTNPDDPNNTMVVDIIGDLSKRKLGGMLRAIGGIPARDSSGTKRIWTFDPKTLDRMSTKYRAIPDTIEILEQTTLSIGLAESDEREEEEDGRAELL